MVFAVSSVPPNRDIATRPSGITPLYTLAYLVINAVPAGRMQEARAAVRKMLELRLTVKLSDARQVCHTRDKDWSERMMDSFREAGLPE